MSYWAVPSKRHRRYPPYLHPSVGRLDKAAFPPYPLPRGFQCIRHYCLLANRHKAACLAKARAVLNLPPAAAVVKESVEDFARRVLGVDIRRCPVCGEGRMRLVATLPRVRGPPDHG